MKKFDSTTTELAIDHLDRVAGGMTLRPTTIPHFPTSTGPTFPVPPKDPIIHV